MHSGRHLDDHSVYHSDHEEDLDSSSEDREENDEPVLEVRGGVVNERDRDLETAASGLEKSRTARSDKSRADPKLVCRFPVIAISANWLGQMERPR